MTPQEIAKAVADDGLHSQPLPFGSYSARIGGRIPYDICITVSPQTRAWLKPFAWFYGLLLRLARTGVCELTGLDRVPTLEQWEQLEEHLRRKGFKYTIFYRLRDGKTTRHTRTL